MKKFLFLFVIVIAVIFRFWNISINPPSLTWDEVAWGYNAYSLGIDGKDEFGRFLPYDYLESFGDFKPPVYAYLDILPVKIFGLNEFSVRFPSAFFGVLTVLISYFLVGEIFYNSKLKDKYALTSAFILAISPWHIMLSRAAFEANVATFFIVFGAWAFLSGIRRKNWHLYISAISFALSLYTFNSSRVVSPLLVLFLAIFYKKQIFSIKKKAFIAFLIGVVVLSPIVKFLLSPQASLRFKEVNIFSDVDVIKDINQQIENDNGVFWSKIIHNRRFVFGVKYLNHYFDNLSPGFLFITGDGNPKFSIQDVGQLYLWESIFLVIGILLLFRKREGNWWIIPLWLIIGIVPAGMARETPHALRTETVLPMFQIFVGYGIVNIVENIKRYKKTFLAIFSVIIFMNLFYFLHGYYVHYPNEYSQEWQYGYKESINFVLANQNEYDQVQIVDTLGRPYIYYLFYSRTDPSFFRQNAKIFRDGFGFVHVESFGKYHFASLLNKQDKNKKILYINQPQQVPPYAKVLKKFNSLEGNTILVAYTQ